jgi:hypothetical protein
MRYCVSLLVFLLCSAIGMDTKMPKQASNKESLSEEFATESKRATKSSPIELC